MDAYEERFWSKVEIGLCWTWVRARNEFGYGKFGLNGSWKLAHRVAWELLVGPIKPGHELDHMCKNRACVNPDHLREATHKKNTLDSGSVGARNARKTHCPKGHPYSGDNLYESPTSNHRMCRTCTRERQRKQ